MQGEVKNMTYFILICTFIEVIWNETHMYLRHVYIWKILRSLEDVAQKEAMFICVMWENNCGSLSF